LSDEICARVQNSQSDLCPGRERSKGLDKASEQTQILCVGRQLLFRHKLRDLNPSNKGEARRSMPFRMNRRMTSTCRILFHPESKAKQNQTAISGNVAL